jgi:hypothetical protein
MLNPPWRMGVGQRADLSRLNCREAARIQALSTKLSIKQQMLRAGVGQQSKPLEQLHPAENRRGIKAKRARGVKN